MTAKNGGGKQFDATRAANVGEREKAITKAVKELYSLQCSVETAVEKYVAPYRDDMKAVRQRLRDEFQVPGKVINARLAVYRLEKGTEDSAAATQEVFKAMPVGTQFTLFDRDAKTGAAPTPVAH